MIDGSNIMSFECSCRIVKFHSSKTPKSCQGCSNCNTSLARKGENHLKLVDHIYKLKLTPRGKALVCNSCGHIEPNSYLKLLN